MAGAAKDARAGVEEAERLLDDGDHTASARMSAETWARLVRARPDLVVAPMSFAEPSVSGGLRLPPRAPWPAELGVTMRDGDGGPEPVFEKERYTMGEAAMMCEYTLDAVQRAEREAPPAA
jgi:hypothetical protein